MNCHSTFQNLKILEGIIELINSKDSKEKYFI